MLKEVLITVKSTQDNDEKNSIEVISVGKFAKMEGLYRVVYEETEISGMEGTTTHFKIYPDEKRMILLRMGSTDARMEFENRKKHVCLYDTPYGVLEIAITTNDLKIDINDDGGKIRIDYEMSVSGQKPIRTILSIDIRPQ
ncbi:DUF1934 domain-containing protein [Clostridium sp. HMP27]|uniref:DUF1934 domain-containing protein n=1 Tax=Clostridium sp. HMP27 TaxID=1487921 RepID=UPI00052D245C|nr:DUF1934 domain-containing protein [Clostridium sp. HMP27]KGK90688.1 hypothetical protein DP68_00405 [Clostridium sp. HMP27]